MENTNWDLYVQNLSSSEPHCFLPCCLREDLCLNQVGDFVAEIQKAQKREGADRCPELPNNNWCNSTPGS